MLLRILLGRDLELEALLRAGADPTRGAKLLSLAAAILLLGAAVAGAFCYLMLASG